MNQSTGSVTDKGAAGDNPAVALDPSIADAWRRMFKAKQSQRTTPVALILPSGMPVTAMRLPVRHLIEYGNIPDPLTTSVREFADLIEGERQGGASVASSLVEQFNENPEQSWSRWMRVLDGVFIACIAQPSFTDDDRQADLENGPFPVADVDYFDKLYVYQWAQGVDQSVADFLREQSAALGALANGEGVSLSSEPVLRIERRGGRMVGVVDRSSDLDLGLDGGTVDAGNGGGSFPAFPQDADRATTEALRGVVDEGDLRAASKPARARRKRVAKSGD